MKKTINTTHIINSISEWHQLLSFPKPFHPLICFINHHDIKQIPAEYCGNVMLNFYIISMKKCFKGKMKYGKNYYDFDEGSMSFISPGQVFAIDDDSIRDLSGWTLMIHPDFIRNYALGKQIKEYGFFSYNVHEALHLSDKEENMVESIAQNIRQEYQSNIDAYSQDVMVSQIELLLNYCNRFYNRQFITRKMVNNDLLAKLDELLIEYFDNKNGFHTGLPTVQYLSEQLSVSPNYLSDMLRTQTGQNTQQHIHNKLIEKAKEALTTTSLSVSEIAYSLGFEYPQSFNKLFKSKTQVSPLEFRSSFN